MIVCESINWQFALLTAFVTEDSIFKRYRLSMRTCMCIHRRGFFVRFTTLEDHSPVQSSTKLYHTINETIVTTVHDLTYEPISIPVLENCICYTYTCIFNSRPDCHMADI